MWVGKKQTPGETIMQRNNSIYLILSLVFLGALSASNALAAAAIGHTVRNPIVRVVTISQAGIPRDSKDLLELTLERLDQAASFRPDIACLPELFSNGAPEAVPGPVTERLAVWARKHSSCVVFGLKTKKSSGVFNSAILLDRNGQIIGQYDKIHPTEEEISRGTTPGDEADPPLFKTDFGIIGIQICFDVNWRDQWRRLREGGARIVFWPSAYPAGKQLPALALLNEYYIVSSTMDRAAHIYDISGESLASSGKFQEWAGAELPLGKRLFEVDYHVEKAQRIQQKYGSKVQVIWYHDSDWLTLASLDPNLTVEDLIAEYKLTPLNEYIARCTKAIDGARAEVKGKSQPRQ
jgi:predicted amidohydrolase